MTHFILYHELQIAAFGTRNLEPKNDAARIAEAFLPHEGFGQSVLREKKLTVIRTVAVASPPGPVAVIV